MAIGGFSLGSLDQICFVRNVYMFFVGVIFWCCLLFTGNHAYKHIIAIHGILSSPKEFANITNYIQKVC